MAPARANSWTEEKYFICFCKCSETMLAKKEPPPGNPHRNTSTSWKSTAWGNIGFQIVKTRSVWWWIHATEFPNIKQWERNQNEISEKTKLWCGEEYPAQQIAYSEQ